MHQTHGFHTVRDTENPEWLEANAPFECRRGSAWLSAGFYFWEKDLARARQWGEFAYQQQEQAGYIILRAELRLTAMLDLVGDPEHQRLMQELVELMRQEDPAWQTGKAEPPLGKVIALMRLRADKTRPEVFPYSSVRAQDNPRPTNYRFVAGRREVIDLNPRLQICVFNKSDATLQPLRIVYPDRYV